MKNKLNIYILILFTAFVLTACNFVKVESIAIIGPSSLYMNETYKFEVEANPSGASTKVRWSSSDEELASVDEDGNVTAHFAGIVFITAISKVNSSIRDTIALEIIDPLNLVTIYKTKVLLIDKDNNYLELLNCPSTIVNEDTKYIKKLNDEIIEVSIDELYIGMENIYVSVDKETNNITKILIDGEKGFSNIRVAVRKFISDIANDQQIYHDSITFTALDGLIVQTFDATIIRTIPIDAIVDVGYENEKIVVKVNNTLLFETDKRIIFRSVNDEENFMLTSIIRNSLRMYHGNFEVSIVNGRLLLINDVNLEKYLYKVVPSEMPSSYHAEALKAQAIAARTYAYMDILRRTYEHLGYTVDDSIKSQVYNNQNPNHNTTAAVDATKGMIMMHDGVPISAFYYSTSSGLTSSAHEVWIEDRVTEPIPYLLGQNLTRDGQGNPIPYNYQDENSMLNFFKLINMYTPDSTVGHHRWRVSFTKTQLTNTINKNLEISYRNYPKSILTQTANGWESKPIPSSIGQVNNIYVNERGTSGVVVSIVIETTTGNYMVINQYNIRFTIRPQDAGSDVIRQFANGSQTNYTGSAKNDSILLSGFFAIAIENGNIVFYGGGNGHGVGMSQNGANQLGKEGKTYEQILTTYYSSIDLVDISYSYKNLEDYIEYFR